MMQHHMTIAVAVALVLAAGCGPRDAGAPRPAGDAPPGMTWIPGGEFTMGSNHPMAVDARPLHQVRVHGFWMDSTEVTNAQFARFVEATGYVTVAERPLDPKDFPDIPDSLRAPGAIVFMPPGHPVSLDNHLQWWAWVPGADWRHPEGPASSIHDRMDHPVVQVAWDDAVAYATWSGGRLPTEAEWEWAARGGLEGKDFVWGDSAQDQSAKANTFQGHFPDSNAQDDHFAGTSPGASFFRNGYGLYGMSGNVWEWTADWYRPDYYQVLAKGPTIAENPAGPASSFDPAEPGVQKRVQKGGSFLCTDQYCSRSRPGMRGKGETSSASNNVGFRCVKDGGRVS